jgi:MYXO-CTERM domain-containing protein
MNRKGMIMCALAGSLAVAPASAEAFCGFYVSGADAELFNNATQVVLMRQGTRTVLSMQNNYQGPPEDFALVVPVPVVLQKENVKTLPGDIFSRVDKLGAPRLVEYWEEDPCAPRIYEKSAVAESGALPEPTAAAGDYGVTIEAQFEVGEYQIVILSAKESTGLYDYLKASKYNIPEGAGTYLEPYVQKGTKFFVAKVDIEKVKFVDGMAELSPLRFHYDSEEFALPIRLGLMNAKDKQDLIVNILAPGQRYELANYPNAFIPTNLEVKNEVRERFGQFYAALFDATLEKNPGAVVTEYAWDAASCDPCPEPPLDQAELVTLGADVIGGGDGYHQFVLTRLHARYGKDSVKDDLVFKEAAPMVGGREHWQAGKKLEEGARPGGVNSFQGRYIIRHEWTGAIECKEPVRGRWGGPPGGRAPQPTAATGLAFVERGAVSLPQMLAEDVPDLGVKAVAAGVTPATGGDTPEVPTKGPAEPKKKSGCGSCSGGPLPAWPAALVVLGLLAVLRRRRTAA